jgi:hypothetical protein
MPIYDKKFDAKFDGSSRECVLACPVIDPIKKHVIGVLEICNPEAGGFNIDVQYLAELQALMLGGIVNRYNTFETQTREEKTKQLIKKACI